MIYLPIWIEVIAKVFNGISTVEICWDIGRDNKSYLSANSNRIIFFSPNEHDVHVNYRLVSYEYLHFQHDQITLKSWTLFEHNVFTMEMNFFPTTALISSRLHYLHGFFFAWERISLFFWFEELNKHRQIVLTCFPIFLFEERETVNKEKGSLTREIHVWKVGEIVCKKVKRF